MSALNCMRPKKQRQMSQEPISITASLTALLVSAGASAGVAAIGGVVGSFAVGVAISHGLSIFSSRLTAEESGRK